MSTGTVTSRPPGRVPKTTTGEDPTAGEAKEMEDEVDQGEEHGAVMQQQQQGGTEYCVDEEDLQRGLGTKS